MRKLLPYIVMNVLLLHVSFLMFAQVGEPKKTDTNTPLHELKPDYPVPYGAPTLDAVTKVLDRVYNYLEANTPAQLIMRKSGEEITDYSKADSNAILKPGDFRLTSYEWGVTYAGMLEASDATGDKKYADYTIKRIKFLADLYPAYKSHYEKNPRASNPMHSVIHPRALDDAGAICAAMIKTLRTGGPANIRPMVDNFMDYISNKEFRLPDGTLARNRPLPSSIWLDDLYMSVPALAQMGKLTGDRKYFDDAVKQILQFSERMFNKEKGVYMHGWIKDMNPHPQFHWGRANGWAILAKVELLDVLPEDHPGRPAIIELLKAHTQGLARYQAGPGFWHQLLDRNDSYLETSATAIYAYCIARAVNKGWLDPQAYAPMAALAWNAVATKVNNQGQVEAVCVGTGMGFDPAYYYYRPVNVFAAHGYGPVLLAGAEMARLAKKNALKINDSALQYYK